MGSWGDELALLLGQVGLTEYCMLLLALVFFLVAISVPTKKPLPPPEVDRCTPTGVRSPRPCCDWLRSLCSSSRQDGDGQPAAPDPNDPNQPIIVDTASDGNCLFRSVSHQLYGSEEHHMMIRGHCMEYVVRTVIDIF